MTRILLAAALTLVLANCSGVPTGRKSPCAAPGKADGSYAVAVSRNAMGCDFHGF